MTKTLAAHVFPIKALPTQKRFMRRFLRNPCDMKPRDFVFRVCEINEMLNQFTGPNGAGCLAHSMKFSMPSSWQRAITIPIRWIIRFPKSFDFVSIWDSVLHEECGYSTETCRTMQLHNTILKEKYKRDIKNNNRNNQTKRSPCGKTTPSSGWCPRRPWTWRPSSGNPNTCTPFDWRHLL